MLYRKIAGVDKRIIKQYLIQQKIRKLHLGCGKNIIGGWLNSDIFLNSNHIVQVDATKRFPFDDETFDYIFSEHMIEHISYPQGQHMLNECFRVLKYGGIIRITTPDLSFLFLLHQNKKSDIQNEYIKWIMEKYPSSIPHSLDTFVINDYMRRWGHKFIYDDKALSFSLKKAGFKEITRYDLNESRDEMLKDLENEKRLPEGFLRLESFTLEGTK